MAAVPKLSTLLPPMPPWRAPPGHELMPAAFTRMAEAAGQPPTHLMADFATLAFGPGRISFSDYERLRLYDGAFWGAADRRHVAGAAAARRVVRIANFRLDGWAVASDRLAAGAYLAAHGLPTAPVLAIYRGGLAAPGATLLRTRDELRQFLEANAGTPLVATPAEGGAPRTLAAVGASRGVEIERLLDAARDAGPVSWLFQPQLAPHPELAGLSGACTAPLRLLTVMGDEGAQVLRAAWRLGGPDDLIASLDVRTGAVLRLSPALAPQRSRPAPAGLTVPDWTALKAAAAEGARLFSQFGLLGWEIAATAEGPVIVAVDPAPDLEAHQIADRRGLLDELFLGFLAERRAFAAEQRRWGRDAA
jgi:hypothetical protein